MSFDVDEDILQDFLVEAGEILEQLQEQLVELENNPEDGELLNAIFRGYHTVKGVFDVMRNGQRSLNAEVMDVILQATDVVVDMFEDVKARNPLEAAPAELIDILHKLSSPETPGETIFGESTEVIESVTDETPEATNDSANKGSQGTSDGIDAITEDEFEDLLDELHGKGAPIAPTTDREKTTTANASSDEISDDEFEALLDDLHGKGQFKSAAENTAESRAKGSAATTSSAPAGGPSTTNSDEISDDEFEALLDQLHGSGKAPQNQQVAKPAAPDSKTDQPSKPAANSPKSVTAQNQKSAAAPASSDVAKSSAPVKAAGKDTKKANTAPQAETTVRVDTRRLDEIMNMVGELVLVRNRLISLGINSSDESMTKAIANLDVVTGDLQGAVMKTRMQPIKKVFGRFPRVVRDLARSLKKEITLELVGEDTDLDKNLVEALADPLVHLVRNSVDHGVEMPDEREAAGKPRMGVVKLAASQEGDHILLTIEDDGKGMDAEKLKQIAIDRGVLDVDAAARMSDVEAYNLIFAPGFSTKTEITDVSGRGVGMDVVKTKINQLNGSVNIHSELGVGTRLEIKVPLTLAILPTLMIESGAQTFALPLGSVNEIINMDIKKTNKVDGQLTMIVRDRAIPLFYLHDWLNPLAEPTPRDTGHVVVVQISTQQVGFVVDALIGQEEVVIKPLDKLLQGTAGMAGATITSDGGIALILDIPSLLKRYANSNLK